ncbi:MAG: FtsX-like permease family protein, partial [Oscillospiraceae bacterium]|nr:FtsX-like permease family protein [Oscillospiraceae bacterium]
NAAAIAAMEATIAAQQQAAAEAQASLDAKHAEVDAKYAEQEAEITAGEAELNTAAVELNAALEQIREGETAIAVGKVQLEAAELELDAAEHSLPQTKAQLRAGWDQYNAGAAKLEAGWGEYYSGKAEAEQKFRDAEAEMADAEKKIVEAEAELADKLQLDLYTLDRSSNAGYVTFESDSEIVDAIAVPFPLFFVLIVALVCITTMTRMVSEERTQIGTMKALGYSGAAIAGKYLLYAGLSALIGCVIGFFLGCTLLPYIIWYAYQIMYTYDALLFYYSARMCLFCILIAVLGTVGSAWLACRKQLAERPAELIRPKAPAVGKRIFLEYITPLWTKLPFLSKVTLRNAFRYPLRVLMMLLGIGGCTALLLTGFGIRDSVEEISAYQYEEIFLYDMTVSYDEDELPAGGEISSLWADSTDAWALTCQKPVTLRADGGKEKSTTLVAAEQKSLEQVISLHKGSVPVAFPGAGEAVITQKLADELNASVGDCITVEPETAPVFSVTVSGICDNYIGHFIYVSAETAGNPANNTALVRAADAADSGKLAASLRSEDGILYVQLSQQARDTIDSSMASIDLVVALIVVCSAALAFITLYNLTNINILERIREVATVKVLGFFPYETARYILSENLLLSFLGAVLGIAAGKYLHLFILQLIRIENMIFDVRIAPLSYVLSFVVTLVFALLTNLFMRRRLDAVSMTESLKSVE